MRGNERKKYCKSITPAWDDGKLILELYKAARRLTKTNGVEFHVDHIVPINHPYVCGLHCLDNLRIQLGLDNIHKSNNHWPDMWEINHSLNLDNTLPHQLSLPI